MPKIELHDVSHIVADYRARALQELNKIQQHVRDLGVTHYVPVSIYDSRYEMQSLLNNLNEAVADQHAYDTKLPLPEKGSYLAMGITSPIVYRVKDITYKVITEQPGYGKRGQTIRYNPSTIVLEQININGELLGYAGCHIHFSDWAKRLASGEVRPVEQAIAKYYSSEDIERIKPLIPYMQIPEGRHICINLLRRLAGEAKRGASKKRKVSEPEFVLTP